MRFRKFIASVLAAALPAVPGFPLVSRAIDNTDCFDMSPYYRMSWSGRSSVNPEYAFDLSTDTAWKVNKNDGAYYSAYMVFYAGDGKVFEPSGIKTVTGGKTSVAYYGTNSSEILFTPNITQDHIWDMSRGGFAEEYELTLLCASAPEEADGCWLAEDAVSGRYRYLVAVPNGWPSTELREIFVTGGVTDETEVCAKGINTALTPADAYSLPQGFIAGRKTVSSKVGFEPFGLNKDTESSYLDCGGLAADAPAVYKINAAGGGYTAYILVGTKNDSEFYAEFNEGEKMTMKKDGNADDGTAILSSEIELEEGVNTVRLYGGASLNGLYISDEKQDITAEPYNEIKLYSLKGRVSARYTAMYNGAEATATITDDAGRNVSGTAEGSGALDMEKLSGSHIYKAQLIGEDGGVLAETEIAASDASFAALSDVTLTNGGGAAAEKALGEYALFDSANIGLDYVLSLDEYKLLYPAFKTAGLENDERCKADSSYSGWERLGIQGHTLGHYLSALSVFYAASGDGDKKALCLEKIKNTVNALRYIQNNSKYMDPESPDYNGGLDMGYIGGIDPAPFNDGFTGAKNLPGFPGFYNNVWAPWYNVHKTYQGLIDVYNNTAGKDDIAGTALEVCEKFSDWAVNGLDMMTDGAVQTMLDGEFGGMGETMYELFEITGNYDYMRTADRFTHKSIVEPLAAGEDRLSRPENAAHSEHANTQIPKINGIAGIFAADPSRTEYKTAAEYFWDRVTGSRSYVFGGNSIEEFFEPLGDETLGAHSAESCNTHNMLLLTQRIFGWDHDSRYMDYYENALYNHIIGTQNPKTGGKSYFTSTLPGGHRTFSTPDSSFWCCVGTGMENPGRYGEAVYYKDGQALYVNLFVNSTLDWHENGMKLSQTTKFPYEDTTTLKITEISGGGAADIKIRVPLWLAGDMTVKLNDGEARTVKADDKGYYTISRTDWAEGDEITVLMPMGLSVYHAGGDNGTAAFRYGPILLGAKLGAYDKCNQTDQQTDASKKTVPAPKLKAGAAESDAGTLISVKDKATLAFTLSGGCTSDGRDYELVPFFTVSTDSYNIYWETEKEKTAYPKNAVGPFYAHEFDTSNADNNILNVYFGTVKKSGTAAELFGFKENHSASGSYCAGMDSGYVTKAVTLPRAGEYTAYVLCAANNTAAGNGTPRTVAVSVDGAQAASAELDKSLLYAERDLSGQISAYIVPLDCGRLEAGEHTVKISSANGIGANFGGFALLCTDWTEPEEIRIDRFELRDNRAEYSVSVPDGLDGTLYTALRDGADGRLLGVRIGQSEGAFDVSDAAAPKLTVMLWNDRQEPLCEQKTAEENEQVP